MYKNAHRSINYSKDSTKIFGGTDFIIFIKLDLRTHSSAFLILTEKIVFTFGNRKSSVQCEGESFVFSVTTIGLNCFTSILQAGGEYRGFKLHLAVASKHLLVRVLSSSKELSRKIFLLLQHCKCAFCTELDLTV